MSARYTSVFSIVFLHAKANCILCYETDKILTFTPFLLVPHSPPSERSHWQLNWTQLVQEPFKRRTYSEQQKNFLSKPNNK